MKISFQQQQQTAVETERHYADKTHSSRSGNSNTSHQVNFFDRREALWGGAAGTGREKGKSLIELQQEAENLNVAVQQDYMTVMSHTMSEKDYARMQEEGFHFESMDPEEAVTIVDRIKAELARAGKHIAGYTDDIDMDTLAAAVGSQALAAALAQSFQQADIPFTEENLNDVVQAWNMAAELRPLEEGTTGYLIDNEMKAEIWNLYVAQNSGAGSGASGAPRYYAEEIQGYYTQSAQMPEDADLAAQVDRVLLQSGREANEENRRSAQWLLEKGYPLTAENLDRLEGLGNLEIPVTEQAFADAAAAAIAEGKSPIHGELAGDGRTVYERAAELADYYQSSEILEKYAGNVTARRQLEEIRLRMTAEVNVKLLKSGFSIDTAPMEQLVEALKQAEAELARQYFPGDAEAVEKYRSFNRANTMVSEIPGLPAQVLGTFAEGQATATLEEFHGEGKALQDTYRKAQEGYETLMTAPRGDLGDSIRKAFANVDDILRDLDLALTEENRRAARILGYNRMEMTVDNIEAVRAADDQVRNVVEKMTPAAVMKMIRDGVNPLEKSFSELEQYFEQLPEDYKEASESYSRFLYGLERNHAVTEEERAGYIGIYRLLRQIEKSDGAVVGALVNTQAELHFSNLLTAVRSGKVKSLDQRVSDELGAVTELIRRGDSISDQVARGFADKVEEILTEVSYRPEAEEEYDRILLEEIRQSAQTDRDSVALLQRGEMTTSAENLVAAQALLHGTEDFYTAAGAKRGASRQGSAIPGAAETTGAADAAGVSGAAGGTEAAGVSGAAAESAETAEGGVTRSLDLWQKLEEKESFRTAYTEMVEEATAAAREATFEVADSSLDVRRMQLIHKQLTVVSHLAQQEEFVVPMYIGDTLSRVHLSFDRSGAGRNMVQISARPDGGESLEASLSLENGTVHGIFTGKTEEEVMKWQAIADTFKEEASQNWTVGDLNIVTADRPASVTNAAKDNNAERTDNAELYRVAKVFLHALGKGVSF